MIDESLKLCRYKLEAIRKTPINKIRVRALYDEKRKLLEDVERLKWLKSSKVPLNLKIIRNLCAWRAGPWRRWL